MTGRSKQTKHLTVEQFYARNFHKGMANIATWQLLATSWRPQGPAKDRHVEGLFQVQGVFTGRCKSGVGLHFCFTSLNAIRISLSVEQHRSLPSFAHDVCASPGLFAPDVRDDSLGGVCDSWLAPWGPRPSQVAAQTSAVRGRGRAVTAAGRDWGLTAGWGTSKQTPWEPSLGLSPTRSPRVS